VAEAIHRGLAGRPVLLLTDYDGTLADIAPTPEDAWLSEPMRREIDALAALPTVSLGVVSGRRLADVAARVGPAATFVAGLHGLEIAGPQATFRHPALDIVEGVIAKLADDAARHLQWCPGCRLENKQYALTCHVRQSPPELREQALEEFEALAEPFLEGQILKLLRGRLAIELLPVAAWDKGRAVGWIRRRVQDARGGPVPVIYLGDDRTDEDAFTVLLEGDAAIAVGERPHTHLIDWRLAGPADVGAFFRVLRLLLLDLTVR
jgi:trehalose-phosphatase